MTTAAPTPFAQVLGFVVSLAICFAAASIGSAVTLPEIGGWYAELPKPSWNPPNWVFGPVWTTLYLLMAVSAWLVWRQAGWQASRVALALFAAQLVLNVLWSILFFGWHRPDLALVDLVALWIAIAATMGAFSQHSRVAAALLAPYLAWVSFAAVLNLVIWRLQP